ncbi:MAG: hypothetical protein QXI91_06630 [Candidatus Bathyarchaeia archaeon]
MRGWRYQPKGWWCPRHPWPPAWARTTPTLYAYPADPKEELRALENLKSELELELAGITKRIEELKRLIQEKKRHSMANQHNLRIAIATTGDKKLENTISHKFGHAKTFTIMDIQNGQIKT